MSDRPRQIFQKSALERLSNPERIDQLLQVVDRKSWLPVIVIGIGIGIAIIWSVWGRIPVTVMGQGVLIYPRQVVPVQMSASGQLRSLEIQVGDAVTKGQIIARISQRDLERQLDQERNRLEELEARNRSVTPLQQSGQELELQAIAQQRTRLRERIVTAQNLAEQRQARLEAYEKLQQEGLATEEQIIAAREAYLQQVATVQELSAQLEELDIRETRISQQAVTETFNLSQDIQESRRRILQYEDEIRNKSLITSKFDGRVIEVAAGIGELLSEGQRIASVETEDPNKELVAIGFFEIKDGKRVNNSMQVKIAPSTVERERHGSILGEVTEVSPYPVSKEAIANLIGSTAIAASLAQDQPLIQVTVSMQAHEEAVSGYAWTSGTGPGVTLSPGTTAELRTTIEHRRPITYVIPALRRLSGI